MCNIFLYLMKKEVPKPLDDAVPAVLCVGMMRVHMTFVTTVGLPLDSVTPPQSINRSFGVQNAVFDAAVAPLRDCRPVSTIQC
jgi:hypothetical protein